VVVAGADGVLEIVEGFVEAADKPKSAILTLTCAE